ncbi:hypothetical protein ACPCG0_10830 [Propionibacteriaceae bacterium Y1923]
MSRQGTPWQQPSADDQPTHRAGAPQPASPAPQPSAAFHPSPQSQPSAQQPGQYPSPSQPQQYPGQPMAPQVAPTGPDGKKVIATLPPLDETETLLDISEATGQPRRHPVMLLGAGLLYAASAVVAVAFGKFWWDAINITNFHASARLLTWTEPRPGSWQSVVWVCVLALVAAAVVAAPAITAMQAWNGHRWSRIASVVSVVISLLTILLNNWALPAIALVAAGTAVLWLRPVSGYFDRWAAFRAEEPRHPKHFETVTYGRLPRYAGE